MPRANRCLGRDVADETGIMTARAFVEARKAGHSLAAYPGERPHDLAEAYRIQDAALSLWQPRPIVGFKVGRINPPDDARLGTDRLPRPRFPDTSVHAAQ